MTTAFKKSVSGKKFKNVAEIENFWALSKAIRCNETAPELVDHSIVYFKANGKTSAWFESELTQLQNINRQRYAKPAKKVATIQHSAKIIDFTAVQMAKKSA